jgi:hypothetical protein
VVGTHLQSQHSEGRKEESQVQGKPGIYRETLSTKQKRKRTERKRKGGGERQKRKGGRERGKKEGGKKREGGGKEERKEGRKEGRGRKGKGGSEGGRKEGKKERKKMKEGRKKGKKERKEGRKEGRKESKTRCFGIKRGNGSSRFAILTSLFLCIFQEQYLSPISAGSDYNDIKFQIVTISIDKTLGLIRTSGFCHSSLHCFETETFYVAQTGLELTILLPQPPECWDSGTTGVQHHTWRALQVFV